MNVQWPIDISNFILIHTGENCWYHHDYCKQETFGKQSTSAGVKNVSKLLHHYSWHEAAVPTLSMNLKFKKFPILIKRKLRLSRLFQCDMFDIVNRFLSICLVRRALIWSQLPAFLFKMLSSPESPIGVAWRTLSTCYFDEEAMFSTIDISITLYRCIHNFLAMTRSLFRIQCGRND